MSHEKEILSLYDKIRKWAKGNFLIAVFFLIVSLIISLGALTESVDTIISFSKKYGIPEAPPPQTIASPLSHKKPTNSFSFETARAPFPSAEKQTSTLNQDYKRRDEILGVSVNWVHEPKGIHYFDFINIDKLKLLINENFLDRNDSQNNSPTAQEILRFLDEDPRFKVAGYVVSPFRKDYRTTITTMAPPEEGLTPEDVEWYLDFCFKGQVADIEKLVCVWD